MSQSSFFFFGGAVVVAVGVAAAVGALDAVGLAAGGVFFAGAAAVVAAGATDAVASGFAEGASADSDAIGPSGSVDGSRAAPTVDSSTFGPAGTVGSGLAPLPERNTKPPTPSAASSVTAPAIIGIEDDLRGASGGDDAREPNATAVLLVLGEAPPVAAGAPVATWSAGAPVATCGACAPVDRMPPVEAMATVAAAACA